MGRVLTGMAAIAAALGWLQLAPAFGLPVTAPAGMLDRTLGANREASPAGWALLLVGEVAFVAFYFLVVARWSRGRFVPLAFAIGGWLVSGAAVMPVVGLLQGAPPAGDPASNPMRANFFMLSLGPWAAAEALIAWLLFAAVLAAGRTLKVGRLAFSLALGAGVLAAAIALAAPALAAGAGSGRVAEGRVAALPTGPVFISVLELPQPPGAVLGPHQHVAGFVADVFGTATMAVAGSVVDVGPGDAFFTADNELHDHANRAAVPFGIALALVVVGLTVVVVLRNGRRPAVGLLAALLIAGLVATVDPLMNHWYFVAVRPAAARGAVMPVPAGHRTYESDNLTALSSGPYLERLTDKRLGPGESARFAGPGAIVVLDGQVSVLIDGRPTVLSAQAGATIAGGTEVTVRSASGARVLVLQVLAPG
jgi:quercetin dioxygenase-like cupin family protein